MKKQSLNDFQQGMTLIELMIALMIGSFLLAGVMQIFLSSKQTYRMQDNMSRLQENGRFAMQFLSQDIRSAGYNGCSTGIPEVANTLNDTSTWDVNFNLPVQGFNDVDVDLDAFSKAPIAGTDAITIVRADENDACIIDNHNPAAASFQCGDNHDLKQGEILVVSNCSHAAIFQMSNVNNNNVIKVITHNVGNAVNPGNCTKGLGLPVPSPCTPNGTPYEFTSGSIKRQISIGYYISTGAGGTPSLFKATLNSPAEIQAGKARTVSNEVVEGIEDMQIVYGVDTDAPKDGTPNYYVDADNGDGVGGTEIDFSQVISVRIELTAITPGDNLTKTGDGRLRRNFSSTIVLRNRL